MQSATVHLPDHVYQRLATAALSTQKPLDTLVLQSIEAGLSPLEVIIIMPPSFTGVEPLQNVISNK